MKSKHLLFLLFFVAGSLYADIRYSVCIVLPHYNEKILQFMGDAAKSFSKEGYSDIAELFEDAQKGVSGFVFFIRNGDKVYVLTNRHAAAYSSSLNLEMEDANRKTVTFENCLIIANRDVERVDNFDAAVKAVKEVYGEDAELVRLPLQSLDNE